MATLSAELGTATILFTEEFDDVSASEGFDDEDDSTLFADDVVDRPDEDEESPSRLAGVDEEFVDAGMLVEEVERGFLDLGRTEARMRALTRYTSESARKSFVPKIISFISSN